MSFLLLCVGTPYVWDSVQHCISPLVCRGSMHYGEGRGHTGSCLEKPKRATEEHIVWPSVIPGRMEGNKGSSSVHQVRQKSHLCSKQKLKVWLFHLWSFSLYICFPGFSVIVCADTQHHPRGRSHDQSGNLLVYSRRQWNITQLGTSRDWGG